MARIIGSPVQPGDNDPVEMRGVQIFSTPLIGYLGGALDASPIYSNFTPPIGMQYWQYYPNGMIACGFNNCACVLYGPIYNLYDSQGQFGGPLGWPTTDVRQLPDGSYCAAFQDGAVWQDQEGNAYSLNPLPPSLVQGFTAGLVQGYPQGLNPDIAGITQFAQVMAQNLADNALQSNSELEANVSKITATVTFAGMGSGGCGLLSDTGILGGGGLLCLPHIFHLHLDFYLKGCAGIFGASSADIQLTIQLGLSGDGQTMQAFMRDFTIQQVSSPGGVGNSELRTNLASTFNGLYDTDLLGAALPAGISVIALVADSSGDVDIYVESLCPASTLMAQVQPAVSGEPLGRLRHLRDAFIVRQSYGEELIRIIDLVGPILLARLNSEQDSRALSAGVVAILSSVDSDGESSRRQLDALVPRLLHLQRAAARSREPILDRVLSVTIDFVRAGSSSPPSFAGALEAFIPVIEREIAAIESE